MNAFKHVLAAIQKRREERITTEHEESVRQQIIDGSDLPTAIHFAGQSSRKKQRPLSYPRGRDEAISTAFFTQSNRQPHGFLAWHVLRLLIPKVRSHVG
jgi:hypothetical protein